MTNLEKYNQAFIETLGVKGEQLLELEFQSIEAWDSVGHMGLIAALEEKFDIMMDMNDIIELSSYEKGKEILKANYDVKL